MNTNTELSIDWYRSPVDATLLQELNQRSDIKGLILTLSHLGVIALTFTLAMLAFAHEAWLWLVVALYAHGTVTKFCINAVHEFVHGTVFRTKWLNTFFCHVYSFIGWIHPHIFWASHTEHHKFTMHPPHDLEVVSPATVNFKHFFRTCLVDRHSMPGTIKGNWAFANKRFAKDGWEAHLLQDDEKTRRKTIMWARTLLTGHLVITVVSIYYGAWLVPVLISLSPAYGNFLQPLCNGLQHTGLPGEVDDFRLSCRTVRLNRFLEFLYWCMNYHTEHHMYAAVPFYNLRKLHRAIKDDLPPIHDGLATSWAEVVAIHHRMQEDPNYRFIQQVPGHAEPELPPVAKQTDSAAVPEKPTVDNPVSTKESVQTKGKSVGRQWECTVCGFIYNEALGLPDEGIAPGTAWDDVPDDWMCPDCGVEKSDFEMIEI